MRKLAPYILLLICGACKKVSPSESVDTYENGLLVLNEGLYQQNNSSLSFYSIGEQKVYQQAFFVENDRGLGDTANDFEKYTLNGKDYIIIAVDVSSQLEIVDATTLNSVARIPIFDDAVGRSPRHVTVSGNRAYSCNFDGSISIIDLESYVEVKTIELGQNPDGMIVRDNKLYVSSSGGLNAPNYDSTIFVMDLVSENVVSTIDARINLGEMIMDSEGDIYILSKGNYSSVGPALVRLNESDEVEGIYEKNITAWAYADDYIYYYDLDADGIYRFNTSADSFENTPLIDCSAYEIPYSISVLSGFIYVADANNYVNSSSIHCYNLSGIEQYEFTAGLNANELILNE